MPQDEPDINNFSTPSEHKLPAITGAQALQDELHRARGISTSLHSLDQSLNLPGFFNTSNGVRRGFVTEVFGPPGSGKSTFGMQVAVNAIRTLDASSKVVWLSTSSPLMHSRLSDVANTKATSNGPNAPSSPPQQSAIPTNLETRFVYKETSSLPHLLVMLMHPTAMFPPPNTTTVIIDGLANFLLSTVPRQSRSEDAKSTFLQEHSSKRANSKRLQLIDNLASALSRLAATRHLAIIVLMNATTSMKSGQRAALKPALSRQGWDAAINTRITLYRDLYPQQYRTNLTLSEKRGYRLAEVTRLNYKDVVRDSVPFVIEANGLRELDIYQQPVESAQSPPTKEQVNENLKPVTLELRTSQPLHERNDYVPLPTASQGFRKGNAALDTNSVVDSVPIKTTAETDPQTAKRVSKRKATEIADSEDEEDEEIEDLFPEPSLPPPPPLLSSPAPQQSNTVAAAAAVTGTEETAADREEMLFDQHEHR